MVLSKGGALLDEPDDHSGDVLAGGALDPFQARRGVTSMTTGP